MTIDDLKRLMRRYEELSVLAFADKEHYHERTQEWIGIRETLAQHGLDIGMGRARVMVALADEREVQP